MRNIHLVSVTTFLAGVGLFAQTAIRPDPNGPSNIGRTQLTQSLDDIAANETTARRATIAAITTRTQAEARHYSTFSLYTPDELRASIATFLARLPSPEVSWIDEHLLVIVGGSRPQPCEA